MANNFTNDSSCISVWLYNSSSGLVADSQGNATLLTSSPTPPGQYGVTQTEGDAAAQFIIQFNCFFYLDGASLPANFPLKSGTSNLTISVAGPCT